MPLISLTLYDCNKLTGVFGLGWGMVGGLKIGNRLRPQGITLNGTLSNLLYFSSPFVHLPHCPRRHRGVQGHASHQLELVQLREAHRCVWSWVGYGRWGQDWKQMLPQGLTLIGNLSRNLLHFSSPFLHLPHCPRRHRGIQGHATHQLELVQLQEAHRYVWS